MSSSELIVDGFGNHKWYDEEHLLHKEDGPAVEYTDGDKFWYKHGLQHREDGPAAEFPNGDKEWYINDKLHREDGPAIDYISGLKIWYYHGMRVNCNSTEEFLRLIKLKVFW